MGIFSFPDTLTLSASIIPVIQPSSVHVDCSSRYLDVLAPTESMFYVIGRNYHSSDPCVLIEFK
jgi:hypothetical protein